MMPNKTHVHLFSCNHRWRCCLAKCMNKDLSKQKCPDCTLFAKDGDFIATELPEII